MPYSTRNGRYLTDEEKQKLAEEEAKEAERARRAAENNKGVRALNQMMGGTLKTKKDLSPLEMVLPTPATDAISTSLKAGECIRDSI